MPGPKEQNPARFGRRAEAHLSQTHRLVKASAPARVPSAGKRAREEALTSAETALLIALTGVALMAKNRLITLAAAIVLLLRVLRVPLAVFSFLEHWGVEIGLIFLTLAVLAPIASGSVPVRSLPRLLLNPVGVAALVGGLAAAWMNARGIDYLQSEPTTIIATVIGSILGATFLRGIPTGPLAAAGITWILVAALRLG